EQGGSRGSEGALSRGQGRRRRSEDEAGGCAQCAPRSDPRAPRRSAGTSRSPEGHPGRGIEAGPNDCDRNDGAGAGGDEDLVQGNSRGQVMSSEHEFESAPDAFPVKLASFEGPLDLLLHLIKKNEVSIHDIPIALITQQYLETIELMHELNLDVAGEFLVMAATLIHIKWKRLLPRPETAAAVEGEEEDPRDALVRRLLEHQKFKAAAGLLHEREQLRAAQWLRPDERVAAIAGDDYEPELEVDLFSLLTAFQ